jgi:hypothetical protein
MFGFSLQCIVLKHHLLVTDTVGILLFPLIMRLVCGPQFCEAYFADFVEATCKETQHFCTCTHIVLGFAVSTHALIKIRINVSLNFLVV